MFVTQRPSIPWPCRPAIVRLRRYRGTWNTNFKADNGLTLLKTKTCEVLQLYILDDCLKIHHESKFTYLLISPNWSLVLGFKFWWIISEGLEFSPTLSPLAMLLQYIRAVLSWEICLAMLHGSNGRNESIYEILSLPSRTARSFAGVLSILCIYEVVLCHTFTLSSSWLQKYPCFWKILNLDKIDHWSSHFHRGLFGGCLIPKPMFT
jgi:hypothetical protein